MPLTNSSVPKADAPVFISTLLVKAPYITGALSRTDCNKAIAAIASAFCRTIVPIKVKDAITPARVKGYITTI